MLAKGFTVVHGKTGKKEKTKVTEESRTIDALRLYFCIYKIFTFFLTI